MNFDTHKPLEGKDGFERNKSGVTVIVRDNVVDN
jgi:hypothetical protein